MSNDNNNDDHNDGGSPPPPTDKVEFINAFDRAHPSTSIDAFHAEEDSGSNQRRRDLVAKAFQTFSPGSSREVLRAAGLDENLNLWRARVAELTNDGVLKKIDKRCCLVTNHKVSILQYVEPANRVRRIRVEPRDEMILALCNALEQIVEDSSLPLGNERASSLRDMIARGRSLIRHEQPRQAPHEPHVDVDC